MKKEFKAPSAKVLNIETGCIICGSGGDSGVISEGTGNQPVTPQSRNEGGLPSSAGNVEILDF